MTMNLEQQPWPKLYQAAELAIKQERWLAAEPLLDHCLRQNPQHAAAHHLLGKVLRQQKRLEEALQEQQKSCQLDPALGWNWFAAGELLIQLKRFKKAAEAFEQALHALPAEGWIRDQLVSARLAEHTDGERPSEGLGPKTYQLWIEEHEPRLPSGAIPPVNPFWLLEPQSDGSQRWRALHASSDLQPTEAALGLSPWPSDGWLVLLGESAQLRDGALQAVECWLAGGLKEQRTSQLLTRPMSSTASHWNQPDLIYADEDCLDAQGQRIDPWFKPGWVEESFWSSPWLGSLSVWRMSWLRDQKLSLPPADEAGRWSWQLMALQHQPKISHIPLTLAHSGIDQQLAPEPLKQYLLQRGERIKSVRPHPNLLGCFQLHWELPSCWSCSVIIPTRDQPELLEQCIKTLLWSTEVARRNGLELEILVVDNRSEEDATFTLFQKWREWIKVLVCDEPFNWSRLNNLAAKQAKGELLLFLNNDIEAIQQGWIEAMASQALRPTVGVVGAQLLYPDRTIQHAGVVVALDNRVDHAYRKLKINHRVHRGRSQLHTAWVAVTGACMMMRKELLECLGGFDESFPVEFNDVDLCLRLSQLGYRCVIPGNTVLIHHESQSRDALNSTTALYAFSQIKARWLGRFNMSSPWWPAQSDPHFFDGRPCHLHENSDFFGDLEMPNCL